tara:strand:- start:124 stop:594 length:471 start_codon:yes stop_codon:yes gene_type:complete
MLRLIRFVFRLFRSAIFLFLLALGLGIALLQTSLSLASATAQVATLSANAATAAALHKKQMAKAISKEKAKARLKRLIVAVPLVGTGAAVAFEGNGLKVWIEENPGKSATDYGCEVASSSAEVMDEVLAELPERFRPSSDLIMSRMPECDKPRAKN